MGCKDLDFLSSSGGRVCILGQTNIYFSELDIKDGMMLKNKTKHTKKHKKPTKQKNTTKNPNQPQAVF